MILTNRSSSPSIPKAAPRGRASLCLLALLSLASARPLCAQTVAFTQESYSVLRGATVVLATAFSAPVPEGLAGYSLRLGFPQGTLAIEPAGIALPAELDFDLFGPSAQREATATDATVSGFIEAGAPAYAGTAFAVFTVTIPQDAPLGTHTLQLEPALPGGNSFVDGAYNGIDTVLVFGSAQLQIRIKDEPPPAAPEVTFVRHPEDPDRLRLIVLTEGPVPLLQSSTDMLNWSDQPGPPVEAGEGVFHFDLEYPASGNRFHRAILR